MLPITVRHALALGVAHSTLRMVTGVQAWLRARRGLELHTITNRHGRRVTYRASRAQPTDETMPPVVCVPGLCVSSRYFVPFMAALAPYTRVYAAHPPGHLGSDHLPSPSVAAYADALIDWLDAMSLKRVALVGNSMGSQVALHVAARAPHRVSHCVLIGPTADARARSRIAQGARLLYSIPFDQRAIDVVVLSDYVWCGPRLGFAELSAMLRDTPEHTARRVTCPVLWVRGAHDAVAPRSWLSMLNAMTPQGRIAEVPAVGHAAHFSAAPVVARLCRAFIKSRPAATRAAGRTANPVRAARSPAF